MAKMFGKDNPMYKKVPWNKGLKGVCKSWNKISDENKIIIYCLNCNKKILVVPSIAKTKKYCSRECQASYRLGRPMLNWNPNSFHEKTGYGISGEYKGIRFRSSLELSFIYRSFQLDDKVIAEPIQINMSNYCDTKDWDVKDNRIYIPDFLLNDNALIEIKHRKAYDLEYPDFKLNIAKIITLQNYCKEHNLKYCILTDEDMGDLVLKNKQIKQISNNDIILYFIRKNIMANSKLFKFVGKDLTNIDLTKLSDNELLILKQFVIKKQWKHAAHALRLLLMGIEFLDSGKFRVDRTGIDAEYFLRVKRGEFSLKEIQNTADKLFKEAKSAKEASSLPEEVNMEDINDLCVDLVENHYSYLDYNGYLETVKEHYNDLEKNFTI